MDERDEAMRQNACIPRSGLALGSLLVKHGILDAAVVEDPEGYDGGRTLAALYDAHMEMVSENVEGHAPAPTRRGAMTGKECDQ
jgi:hypothetical protein